MRSGRSWHEERKDLAEEAEEGEEEVVPESALPRKCEIA